MDKWVNLWMNLYLTLRSVACRGSGPGGQVERAPAPAWTGPAYAVVAPRQRPTPLR